MKVYRTRCMVTLIGLMWFTCANLLGVLIAADLTSDIGEIIPSFSLPRADASGEFASIELKGKPAVIVFWRPNQRFSTDALRDLETLLSQIGSDRFQVIAIDSARSSPSTVQNALKDVGLSFPILLDQEREVYGLSDVIVSPTTLLLDSNSHVRFRLASHPPTYARIINARIRFLLGQMDEAEMQREIEPAVLKIDLDLAAAWRMYNLGRRLQSEGKLGEAKEMFEKAVTKHPSLAEARSELGFMQLAAGDYETAANHFQTALRYHPASPVARLGQAAVLARTGDPQQAEQILLGLLGHNSVAVRARYELGRIYRSRGEDERAVVFFEDALSALFPETGPHADKQAMIEHNQRETDTQLVSRDQPIENASRTTTPERQTVNAIVPPADATYVGVKTCKKCHFQQWKSWSTTKMASAFDLLKPNVRVSEKTHLNLDPQRDYTTDPDCLPCHTTGYNHNGGYSVPMAGDAAAERAAKELTGTVCEACHGPGSRYIEIHTDVQSKERRYAQSEFFATGQYNVDATVCAACHRQEAPCIPSDRTFDFDSRKEQGTHKHYNLRFREP